MWHYATNSCRDLVSDEDRVKSNYTTYGSVHLFQDILGSLTTAEKCGKNVTINGLLNKNVPFDILPLVFNTAWKWEKPDEKVSSYFYCYFCLLLFLSFNVNSFLQRCIFEDASVPKYIIKRATDADFLDLLVFQTCNLVLIKELYQEVNNKPLEVYSRTLHDTEILRPNFVEGREPHSSVIFKYEEYNNWSTAERKQFDLTRDKKDKRLKRIILAEVRHFNSQI